MRHGFLGYLILAVITIWFAFPQPASAQGNVRFKVVGNGEGSGIAGSIVYRSEYGDELRIFMFDPYNAFLETCWIDWDTGGGDESIGWYLALVEHTGQYYVYCDTPVVAPNSIGRYTPVVARVETDESVAVFRCTGGNCDAQFTFPAVPSNFEFMMVHPGGNQSSSANYWAQQSGVFLLYQCDADCYDTLYCSRGFTCP